MIAIVDYDVGNVASVANMLRRVGVEKCVVTRDPDILSSADKVILPGVGAFDRGMENLVRLKLVDPLEKLVLERGVPFLGICLGMQLLTHGSEEGNIPGLGWLDAQTRRFSRAEDLKVPHMGWNSVAIRRPNQLFRSKDDHRFYFVHGYYVECQSADDVIATTRYGIDFASVVGSRNIFGVQFHPEKSHRFGMALMKSFVDL